MLSHGLLSMGRSNGSIANSPSSINSKATFPTVDLHGRKRPFKTSFRLAAVFRKSINSGHSNRRIEIEVDRWSGVRAVVMASYLKTTPRWTVLIVDETLQLHLQQTITNSRKIEMTGLLRSGRNPEKRNGIKFSPRSKHTSSELIHV